jgi:hypothetical protein
VTTLISKDKEHQLKFLLNRLTGTPYDAAFKNGIMTTLEILEIDLSDIDTPEYEAQVTKQQISEFLEQNTEEENELIRKKLFGGE